MKKKEIIDKAKKLLEISENQKINVLQLYDKLHTFRKNYHPDSFQSSEAKSAAEENFKEANSLLDDLKKFIEIERAETKTTELISYTENYDLVEYKHRDVLNENKINDLLSKVELLNFSNSELKKEVILLKDKKLDKTRQELVEIYKPKNQSWLIAGIAFLLSTLIAILTSIKNIGSIVTDFFPFEIKYFNFCMLFIILMVIGFNVLNYFKSKYITKLSKLITTSSFVFGFVEFLNRNRDDKSQTNRFKEGDVTKYLNHKLSRRVNKFIRYFISIDEIILDNFKDIFIYNLIKRELVVIEEADGLDRIFRIKEKNYKPWHDVL